MSQCAVLIADSDGRSRETVKACLNKALPGASILESTDGKDALQKMRSRKVDLLITEVRLPEMDGNQLFHALASSLAIERPSKILILSDIMPDTQLPSSVTLVSYLSKPIQVPILISYLEKAMLKSRIAPGTEPPAPAVAPAKMNADMINRLIDGVILCFRSMGKVEFKRGRISLGQNEVPIGDYAGITALKIRETDYRFVLAVDRTPLLAVLNQMFSCNLKEVSSERLSVLSKISNTACSYVKRELGDDGKHMQVISSSALTAQNNRLSALPSMLRVAAQLTSDHGPIRLELQFLNPTQIKR